MEYNNRILVVDDNEAIHGDFRKLLEPRPSQRSRVEYIESALFGDDDGFDLDGGLEEHATQPQQGYELSFAFQAEEAIEKVVDAERAGKPFSVIFTDVRMPPGLDGVQLVEQLLKIAPFVEIVIVTAYSDYSWDELNQKFGWTDRILILRKPFDGITIKQISSTLTKKWALGNEARQLAASMSSDLITLERQVEERTARLAQAYKELQNFAYIVSHDLRSPLVSIRGFVSELRFDLEKVLRAVDVLLPNLDEDQQQALETALRENIPEAMDFIDTSTNKMDRLIKGILKLARLGHRKFQYEQISLSDVFYQQQAVLSYPIEKGGIKVVMDKLPGVVCDRLAMDQIASNLLSNAVKFLRPDVAGIIEIFSDQDEEGNTLLHIKDNGRGIDENDQEAIFEIFQRGGIRDVPGEGMGLTFVKTLVQRMGGNISCRSTPGEGSTFTVQFCKEPEVESDLEI